MSSPSKTKIGSPDHVDSVGLVSTHPMSIHVPLLEGRQVQVGARWTTSPRRPGKPGGTVLHGDRRVLTDRPVAERRVSGHNRRAAIKCAVVPHHIRNRCPGPSTGSRESL
jgi:hypothetical protein